MPSFFNKDSKTKEVVKLDVSIELVRLEGLPAKYSSFRISLSRGAKVVKSDQFQSHKQIAEPRFISLRIQSRMERSGSGFQEKIYKLSLIRINTSARMGKEKSLGSIYLNLGEHVSSSQSIAQVKLAMKVAKAEQPTWVTLNISFATAKKQDGSDTLSERSSSLYSAETASQATSQASMDSIDEEIDDQDDDYNLDRGSRGDRAAVKSALPASPEPLSRQADGIGDEEHILASPADPSAIKQQIQGIKEQIRAAEQQLKDIAVHEKLADESLERMNSHKSDLKTSLEFRTRGCEMMRQDNQVMQSYGHDLQDRIRSAARNRDSHLSILGDEVSRARAVVERLTRQVAQLEEEEATAGRLENSLKTASSDHHAAVHRRQPRAAADSAQVMRLKEAIIKEKSKSVKYQGWIEDLSTTRKLLEEELAEIRLTNSNANFATDKLSQELERVSGKLIDTSLKHAQAEHEKLEYQLQARKWQDSNIKLQIRLAEMERKQKLQ